MSSLFGLVLSKYSNQKKLFLSYAINTRPKEFNDVLGCFVNNIPLKLEFDGVETFDELIKLITKQRNEVKAYQGYSLTSIIEDQRKLGHSQVDTSMNVSFVQTIINDVSIDTVVATNESFNEIGLMYDQDSDVIKFRFEYRKALFDEVVMRKLLQSFRNAINEVISGSEFFVKNYSALSPAEYQEIVYDWNATEQAYPQDQTIVDLFEAQVSKSPDAVALVYEGEELSYRELDQKSNQLVRHIRAEYKQRTGHELEPGTLIALCLDRSLEMVIGILGVLKAGGAYVPIDTSYPEDRIAYVLEDTRSALVLSQKHLMGEGLVLPLDKVLCIDLEASFYKEEDSSNVSLQSSPSDLAYVIYTSGTTGTPKGVMVENRSLINRLEWMQTSYSLTDKDVILQKTPYSFDVSVWELFWWMLKGSQLCILNTNGHKDPKDILSHLEKYDVSVIHFVPSMLSSFLDYIKTHSIDCTKFKCLKQVYVSGEALTVNQNKDFFDSFPNVSLMNLYGPTEATIDVTYFECLKGLESIPIGKPIFNTQMYILNDSLQPLPIGVPGQLYVSGAGVARGYLNKPELTSEKFIDNPFIAGSRMYHTGDLASWLPDGNIEYLGRNDNQVKIRGYRIELGEIESTLLDIEGVAQSCVLCKQRDTGSVSVKYLVGYYVLESGVDPIEDSVILETLSTVLPDYMLPSALVRMDHFPLTVNGKLNKRLLPNPDFGSFGDNYVAPKNDKQLSICRIWEEVLGLEQVGIEDDFFRIGGDSIVSIRLASKINDLGFNISVRDIFIHKTIASIIDNCVSGTFKEVVYENF